jgi:hypothetical protein
MKVSTYDETTSGQRLAGPVLELSEPRITVATLIESRIRSEVESGGGLVRPESGGRKIDVQRQIAVAFKAFDAGRLIVLLADRQAARLDEALPLSEGDEVTFLRLVPLVGG